MPTPFRSSSPLSDHILSLARASASGDESFAAHYGPGMIVHDSKGDRTVEDVLQDFAYLRTAFTDFRIEPQDIVADGRFAASRVRLSGVFDKPFSYGPIGPLAPTGERIEWEAMTLCRFDDDDLVVEEWLYQDLRALIHQLSGAAE